MAIDHNGFHSPTIDLSNATSSLDGDADVEVGESLSAQKEHGLHGLHLEALGLENVNGLTVQLHDSFSIRAVSNGNCSLLHCVRSICLHNSSLQILRTLRPKACTEGFASADMIGSIQRKVIPKDKKQEGGGANDDDLVLAQMALRPPGSVCFSTMNGNGMDWKRETGLTCLEKRGFAIWFFRDHAI